MTLRIEGAKFGDNTEFSLVAPDGTVITAHAVYLDNSSEAYATFSLLGAAIEQNHDARGIIWPRRIAPFEVVVVPLGYGKSQAVREVADDLYRQLTEAGVDVILDDRDERPGVMFADWELIGVPLRVTVGERSLKEGKVELVRRQGLQTQAVVLAEVMAVLQASLAEI